MRTNLRDDAEPVTPPHRRTRRCVAQVATGVAGASATIAATATVAFAQGVGGGLGDGGTKAAPATSGSSTGLIVAAVVGAVVVIVAIVVVAVLVSRSRSTARPAAGAGPVAPTGAPLHAPGAPVGGPPPLPADGGRSVHERDRLVQVLIELGDQLDSVALRAWVTQALSEVGVATIVVDGQPFDPARHQAVDQVGTADPAAVGRVAQTVRAGYTDRERLLRLPQVVVYRAEAAS